MGRWLTHKGKSRMNSGKAAHNNHMQWTAPRHRCRIAFALLTMPSLVPRYGIIRNAPPMLGAGCGAAIDVGVMRLNVRGNVIPLLDAFERHC